MDDILTAVADALDWLDPPPVFVGGAIIALYLDPTGGRQVRPTDDVDLIVPAVQSLSGWLGLQQALAEHGWSPDPTARTICRYISPDGCPVDFMAQDPTVLGFAGRWYPAAVASAEECRLSTGRLIRRPSTPHLLACKLEAYSDRGREDPWISKDLEDIVALVDGRATLLDEVTASDVTMRAWLAGEVQALLTDQRVLGCLDGHLPRGGDQTNREHRLRRTLTALATYAS